MIRQDVDVVGKWLVTIFYNVDTGYFNTGFTHSNTEHKRSIVVIGLHTSKELFLNTVVHELKHVQSVICSYYDIDEDGEDAAYLIGYLVQKMYDKLIRFIK